MRRKQARNKPEQGRVVREPLSEGIIPLKGNGNRDWASMGDGEMVAYARRFISEKGIDGRRRLCEMDNGLYLALRKRGLLDRIGLESKRREWSRMDADELLAFARRYVSARGIESRSELKEADRGLALALWRRGLVDRLGLGEKNRGWSAMSDDELVAFAQSLLIRRGLDGRTELQQADRGLYRALGIRKLMDRIGVEARHRDWASMGDEELVAFARSFISEKGIDGRLRLCEMDNGLYLALRKRGLLDRVGLERQLRVWSAMGDDELVSFARRFIAENGITWKAELRRADLGLLKALQRRKLQDDVGLEDRYRDWASMSEEELKALSLRFMAKRRICGKTELQKAFKGLYYALWKRKLVDEVFSELEALGEDDGVREVVKALEEFG